jgi:hypothetical protein
MTTQVPLKPRIPVDALTACDDLIKAGDITQPVRLSDLAILNVMNIEIHKNCMAKQRAFAQALNIDLITDSNTSQ